MPYSFTDYSGNQQYAATSSGTGSNSSPYVLTTANQALTLTSIAGTFSTSGNNTIIAAPTAGIATIITYLQVQNESSTATTVTIYNGTTLVRRILLQNQGDALINSFENSRALRLTANTALIINLSATNSHNYSIDYYQQ